MCVADEAILSGERPVRAISTAAESSSGTPLRRQAIHPATVLSENADSRKAALMRA